MVNYSMESANNICELSMLREQNGYKEETDEEFLSEALTLLRKITDEAAKKNLLAQIKAISTL